MFCKVCVWPVIVCMSEGDVAMAKCCQVLYLIVTCGIQPAIICRPVGFVLCLDLQRCVVLPCVRVIHSIGYVLNQRWCVPEYTIQPHFVSQITLFIESSIHLIWFRDWRRWLSSACLIVHFILVMFPLFLRSCHSFIHLCIADLPINKRLDYPIGIFMTNKVSDDLPLKPKRCQSISTVMITIL